MRTIIPWIQSQQFRRLRNRSISTQPKILIFASLKLRTLTKVSQPGREYGASWVFYGVWVFTSLVGIVTTVQGILAGTLGTTYAIQSMFEVMMGILGLMINLIFNPRMLYQKKKLTADQLGNILVLTVIGWPILSIGQYIAIQIWGVYAVVGVQGLSITSFLTGSTVQSIYNMALVLEVAVNEELLFRRGIQVAVETATGSFWKGLIISSLAFGLTHIVYSGNPGVILGVSIDGAILGAFHFISKRSEVPMGMHFLADIAVH